jgi:hypothetical protein
MGTGGMGQNSTDGGGGVEDVYLHCIGWLYGSRCGGESMGNEEYTKDMLLLALHSTHHGGRLHILCAHFDQIWRSCGFFYLYCASFFSFFSSSHGEDEVDQGREEVDFFLI